MRKEERENPRTRSDEFRSIIDRSERIERVEGDASLCSLSALMNIRSPLGTLSRHSRVSREHGELIRAVSDKMDEHAEPVPTASSRGFGAGAGARNACCGDDDDEKSLAY